MADANYNYVYDQEGNRTDRIDKTTGESVHYDWDHRNRLTLIIFLNGSGAETKRVEYEYNVDNLRIAKRVSTDGGTNWDIQRYALDGSDVVLVFDENETVEHTYFHGPAVDQIFADENATGEILWALSDHQGTVRDWIDADDASTNSSAPTQHVEYSAFGEILAATDEATLPSYSYTGREWDADAELYYYRNRWYDPVIGKFANDDPIGFAAGDSNLQRYVGNNSPNSLDPSGTEQIFLQDGSVIDSNSPQWKMLQEQRARDGGSGNVGRANLKLIGEGEPVNGAVIPFTRFWPKILDESQRLAQQRKKTKRQLERQKRRQDAIAEIGSPESVPKNLDRLSDMQTPLTANHRKLFWRGGGIIESDHLSTMTEFQHTLEAMAETPIVVLTMVPGGSVAKIIVYKANGEVVGAWDYVAAGADVIPLGASQYSKLGFAGKLEKITDEDILVAAPRWLRRPNVNYEFQRGLTGHAYFGEDGVIYVDDVYRAAGKSRQLTGLLRHENGHRLFDLATGGENAIGAGRINGSSLKFYRSSPTWKVSEEFIVHFFATGHPGKAAQMAARYFDSVGDVAAFNRDFYLMSRGTVLTIRVLQHGGPGN